MYKGILWCLALVGFAGLWWQSHCQLLNPPADDAGSGKLVVYGLLRTGSSKTFSLEDLQRLNVVSFFVSDSFSMKKTGQGRKFQGIRLGDLLRETQPAVAAPTITLVGADGYHSTVPSADIPNYPIYICFMEEGKPIDSEKGPFRVIVDLASATLAERKRLEGVGVWNLRKIFIGLQPQVNRKNLEIWSAIPPLIMNQVKVEFESGHPEIQLQIQTLPSSLIHSWVSDSLASPTSVASFPDLIWFSEPSDAERLKMAGKLIPYFPQNVDAIPGSFRDPDGYYTGVRLLRLGFVCNTNFPIPQEMKDLLREEYRGKIAWVRPGQIGTYMLSILVGNDDLGWDFIRQILQNTTRENVFSTFGDACDRVVSGKAAVGVTLDYLVFNLRRANPDVPIRFVQPTAFPVFMASPIAIFHETPRVEEAKVFIDAVLSEKTQALLTKNGFTTTRADLPLPDLVGSPPMLMGTSTIPLDHRYVAVQAPVLQRCYEELETQVHGE